MQLKVSDSTISEMKALIESGDLDLDTERAKFKAQMGRDTTLNDEQLIRACGATDDDDIVAFCANVCAIEQGA